jgi:hypothetical protein
MRRFKLDVNWTVTEAMAVAEIFGDLAAGIWDEYHEEIGRHLEARRRLRDPEEPEEDDTTLF